MSASRALPDVAFESAALARPLDWVGMEGIALPFGLGAGAQVAAKVDVAVNLGDADKRGIHMSRLYLHLQQSLPTITPDAASLAALMRTLIESQQGIAQHARLDIRYDQLLERAALISEHRGWKRYPVHLQLEADGDELRTVVQVEVDYSSTCPASAALSREINAQAFAQHFEGETPSTEAVRDWLASKAGLAATPHAQRSTATVRVELRKDYAGLPVQALVDALEAALGTPVQTAVKREDEQAFAEANARNLMFCEDAARRVAAALTSLPWVSAWDARVAHFESLHAHDAVARVSGYNG